MEMRVTAITPRDDANLPLATHAGTHRLASCTIPAARGMGQFWCPMIARGSGRDRSTTDSPTAGNRPKPSRKRAFPGASELCGTLALLGEDHSAPGHAGIRVGAPTARGSNSPIDDKSGMYVTCHYPTSRRLIQSPHQHARAGLAG